MNENGKQYFPLSSLFTMKTLLGKLARKFSTFFIVKKARRNKERVKDFSYEDL